MGTKLARLKDWIVRILGFVLESTSNVKYRNPVTWPLFAIVSCLCACAVILLLFKHDAIHGASGLLIMSFVLICLIAASVLAFAGFVDTSRKISEITRLRRKLSLLEVQLRGERLSREAGASDARRAPWASRKPYPGLLEKARTLAECAHAFQEEAQRERTAAYQDARSRPTAFRAMGRFLVSVHKFHYAASWWREVVGILVFSGVGYDDERFPDALEQLGECESGIAGIVYDYLELEEDRAGISDLPPEWDRLFEIASIESVAGGGLHDLIDEFRNDEFLSKREVWGADFPWTEKADGLPWQPRLQF